MRSAFKHLLRTVVGGVVVAGVLLVTMEIGASQGAGAAGQIPRTAGPI